MKEQLVSSHRGPTAPVDPLAGAPGQDHTGVKPPGPHAEAGPPRRAPRPPRVKGHRLFARSIAAGAAPLVIAAQTMMVALIVSIWPASRPALAQPAQPAQAAANRSAPRVDLEPPLEIPTTPGAAAVQRLDNGLEFLLLPEPGHDLIAVQTWYRVGTRDETPATAGLAHLLELLMFTGTVSVSNHHDAIARLRGTYGSATWPDVTLYYTDVPASGLERVLEIEADRMQGLTFAPEVVDASAQSIAFGISRMVQERPQSFVDDRLRALAFGRDHPYANPLVRVPAASGEALVELCRGFYRDFYRPDNACLIIAGDLDVAAVTEMVRDAFGELAGESAAPRHPLPPIATASHRRDVLDLGLGFPTVSIGYPLPGSADDELTYAALRLLARYLDGPGRSDWTAGLVDPTGRPQVIDVETHLLIEQHQGLIIFHGALADPSVADDVEARIIDSLASIGPGLERRDEPGEADSRMLADLRDRELLSVLGQRATTSARASELGRAYVLRGDQSLYGRDREQLEAVTWHDIARAAGLLQPARAVAVHMRSEM